MQQTFRNKVKTLYTCIITIYKDAWTVCPRNEISKKNNIRKPDAHTLFY